MLQKKDSPVIGLALLLTLTATFEPLRSSLIGTPALAQFSTNTNFPIPASVPKGTKVRIDGSSSMAVANEALKQRFQSEYPGTSVEAQYSGTPAALQAVLDDKADLAAIGRPLTADEKAKGLVAIPVGRGKIAMIVGPNSVFNGILSDAQFARMFRGEITNWSEVGGPSVPIRFIDRPDESDTRQALRNYPVFRSSAFQNGATTAKAANDSTAAVIKELGTDGIGYAIANQVLDQPGVRVVSMHQTDPRDPRYPFSQPLFYVYKQQPNAAAKAFLGYATASQTQQAFEDPQYAAAALAAGSAAAVSAASPPVASPSPASPSPTVAPSAVASPTTVPAAPSPVVPEASPSVPPVPPPNERGGVPPWLPLLLLLGLIPLFALFRRRRSAEPVASTPAAPPRPTGSVPPRAVEPPATPAVAPPPPLPVRTESPRPSVRAEAAPTVEPPLVEPPVPTVEDFPATGFPTGAAIATGAGLAAAGAAAWATRSKDAVQEDVEATKFDVGQTAPRNEALADVDVGLPGLPSGYSESRIVLMPRDPQWAYAYWDTPNEHKAAVRQQGGQRLALRLYDVTGVDLSHQNSHSMQQYDCEEMARDWLVPIPVSDRDYLAEIGYLTEDGRWLLLARSNSVRIPPVYPTDWYEDQLLTVDWEEELRGKSLAELLPPGSRLPSVGMHDQLYQMAKAAEAQRVDGSIYGSMQPVPGSAQMVESSYVHQSGVGMSGVGMSGVGLTMSGVGYSMSGVGMAGQMSGVGLTMSGVGYSMSGVGMFEQMSGVGYSMSGVGMSGVGMAGQMSGVGYSMSGVGLTMSGVGYSMSGVGMSGVGMLGQMSGVGLTMSGVGYSMSGVGMSGVGMLGQMSGVGYSMSGVGLTMSGVGYSMSGVGMSGVGFFASMPPIRARKFWLVADSELIIYGATEPDATVTIAGRPVKLNPDGTFRFHMSFPDGGFDFPILAVAADGEQTRSIRMTFNRETPFRKTNTKEEAIEEQY